VPRSGKGVRTRWGQSCGEGLPGGSDISGRSVAVEPTLGAVWPPPAS
jgi:hypothetical protein